MNATGQRYQPDFVVGLIILILSLCGVCAGAAVAGVGSIIGTDLIVRVSGGSIDDPGPGTSLPSPDTRVIGGLIAVLGIAIAIVYLLNVIGAIGVMGSKRWGLMLTAILSSIALVLSVGGSDGFLGVLPNLAAAIYCFSRVGGKLGPTPI